MKSLTVSFVAAALMLTGSVRAAEKVAVPGSEVRYDSQIQSTIGDKAVSMKLTGTALRKKVVFSVYAIASYVEDGSKVRTGEQLAAVDSAKQLHLVMERDLDGKEMADAFRTAIRANYAEPTYETELAALTEMMKAVNVKKGDHVWLTHVPGRGLHCDLVGKKQFMIEKPEFSRAVWDIYFGKNNLGDAVKKGLSSRL